MSPSYTAVLNAGAGQYPEDPGCTPRGRGAGERRRGQRARETGRRPPRQGQDGAESGGRHREGGRCIYSRRGRDAARTGRADGRRRSPGRGFRFLLPGPRPGRRLQAAPGSCSSSRWDPLSSLPSRAPGRRGEQPPAAVGPGRRGPRAPGRMSAPPSRPR